MADPVPSFIRVNQTQWVHLSTIKIIEKVDQKYHLWVSQIESQPVKIAVDPDYTRMEEILEKLTFQTSPQPKTPPPPVSLNELMIAPRVIEHRFPVEVLPLPEYPLSPEPKQSVWIGQIAAQPNRRPTGSVKNPNSFESHLGSLI